MAIFSSYVSLPEGKAATWNAQQAENVQQRRC